ncbi:MAG TPA: cupin domain-containing protein [Acidimicrobiia bacterium]|nr:cupin domain-containing protein [Acidimicrobiia bacterium]
MVRCVVTGQQADGKSVVVFDGVRESPAIPLMPPGSEFIRLWGADATPTLPSDGTPPDQPTFFPPAGGYRFLFFTLPPESTPAGPVDDPAAALAELEATLPDMARWMEPENPGMHTTDSVDLDIVLSGEVWLELDDGAEVHLKEGDCVVQNGTRHAWRNRSDRPVQMFAAIIGATRA